jgi:hypothetical protein
MSLDIAIVDDDDRPIDQVALGVDEHHQLMTKAAEVRLINVLRFSDYYAEASIETAHLPGLIKECESLLIQPDIKAEVIAVVCLLLRLARRADEEQRRILAIPD